MKYYRFLAVCFVAAAIAAPAFGDEITVNLESRVIDDFSGSSGYQWRSVASKFTHRETDEDGNVTDEFPKLSTVTAYPVAIFKKSRRNPDAVEPQSLGIRGAFDRRGYNWIDIYPVKANENGETEKDADGKEVRSEIPLPGRTQYLDLWVWGSNYNYYIEAYVRDYIGVVHALRLGELGYTGWKNLRVNVPRHIPQAKRILPRLESLAFVKFRIWTQPTERVNDFYVYFNQFKTLTDTFESFYDGDELADPEYIEELWENAQ